MKKMICWLLTLAICLGLAACGTPAPVETSAPATVPTTAPASTTPATTAPAETQPAETTPVETEPAVTEPALDNPGAIIDAAYALADGESMDQEVTLTGTVSSVDTAWSEQYQNITVTIKVAGYEDKPVMCYRLAGEGAKDLAYGDVITVTGTIKNYSGIIEFAQGCRLISVIKGTGEGPESPIDYDTIVADAKALKPGQSLPYVATLTGRVESIDYPYSAKYNDMSITIEVRGQDIYCFRLTSPRTDWLQQVGEKDWVTVMGKIKNYNGTIEFDSAKMIAYTDYYKVEGPEDPLEHIDAAYELKEGKSLEYESTLTGVITSVDDEWSDEYKNITVTIQVPGREDKPIVCFRLTGEGAEDLAVGDTITVTGTLKNYAGTVEFDSGCKVSDIVKGEAPVEPEKPEEPATLTYVTEPKAGTAYKLGLDQTVKESIYFFTGEMSGYYGASEKNWNDGVDVYLEEVTGGYRLYFMDANGTKQYINLLKSGTHYNFTFDDAAVSVFEFDEDKDALRTEVEGEVCYMGTYGNYVTFGVLQNTKLKDADYIARLYVSGGSSVTPDTPTIPEDTTPEETTPEETTPEETTPEETTPEETTPEETTPEETTPEETTPEEPAATLTTSAPKNGDVILIYHPNSGSVISTTASGSKLTGVEATVADGKIALADGMAELTVTVDGDYYIFSCGGKYLATGYTGSNLYFADELNNSARWKIEEAEGGWYLVNARAIYSKNLQYIEYYSGKFTTYKLGEGGAAYLLEFYFVEAGTPVTIPAAVTPETPAEIVAAAYDLIPGASLEGSYTLTGEITSISGSNTVMTVEGKDITCYKLASGAASVEGLGVGDTITVTGKLKNYNGMIEFDSGCVLDAVVKAAVPLPTATALTSAPVAGDVIVICNGSNAMTATASGKKLTAEAATIADNVLTVTDTLAQLTVSKDGDYYIFSCNGKYLAATGTGNNLGFQDSLDQYAKWTLESAGEGVWYIISAGANYNGNYNQAIEYYNGFTTYGKKTTDIYKMQLFKMN